MTTVWQEALERLEGSDLLQLGMDADAVRASLSPERVVTYTIGHEVVIGSTIDGDGLWLAAAEAAVERGAQGFVLRTADGADRASVAAGLRSLHAHFPGMTITGFCAEDVATLARATTIEDILERWMASGFAALGSSTEAPTMRAPHAAMNLPESLASGTCFPGSASWEAVHRAAHRIGLPTTATLPLRSGDTSQQWIGMLEAVAQLQDETQGFLACEPRIEHMERELDEVTGARYLQFIALARIYLPGVPHIQADWSIFGPKVLQLALRFGADDAGFVAASARDLRVPSHHAGEEELRRIIRDAGFAPSQRDAVYGKHFVY